MNGTKIQYCENSKTTSKLRSKFGTSRNEERLRLVEVNATNGTIMLVESINQGPHAIVP